MDHKEHHSMSVVMDHDKITFAFWTDRTNAQGRILLGTIYVAFAIQETASANSGGHLQWREKLAVISFKSSQGFGKSLQCDYQMET